MKIAVCGKGGVGKTLVAGTLARLLGRDGYRVLAVDCDSNPNLYLTLGISKEKVMNVTPISEDLDLIEERTGAKPGSGWGTLLCLTPEVDDIPDKYAIEGPDNVKLLVVGSPPRAGSGCLCPAYSLVQELLRHLILKRNEVVILDMEAGLEHFGRAVTRGIDLILLITEPTRRSLETIVKMKKYLLELEIKNYWIILNKVTANKDVEYSNTYLAKHGLKIKYTIPYDEDVLKADIKGVSILDYNPQAKAVKALMEIKEEVKHMIENQSLST